MKYLDLLQRLHPLTKVGPAAKVGPLTEVGPDAKISMSTVGLPVDPHRSPTADLPSQFKQVTDHGPMHPNPQKPTKGFVFTQFRKCLENECFKLFNVALEFLQIKSKQNHYGIMPSSNF